MSKETQTEMIKEQILTQKNVSIDQTELRIIQIKQRYINFRGSKLKVQK